MVGGGELGKRKLALALPVGAGALGLLGAGGGDV